MDKNIIGIVEPWTWWAIALMTTGFGEPWGLVNLGPVEQGFDERTGDSGEP